MTQESEVKAFAWPTVEPEIPARPEVVAPGPVSRQQGAATAGTESVAAVDSAAHKLPAGVDADSTFAFIWDNAAAAAAVLRTMMLRNDPCTTDESLAGLSARQLAAAFLSGVGAEIGGAVMRHLQQTEAARWVGCALAEEPPVTHRIAMAALQTVQHNIEVGEYLEESGAEYATRLFAGAFYHGQIPGLLRPAGDDPGFQDFDNVAPDQLAPYVSHEHPQTIALFLSQLPPSLAAKVLANFPQRLQADVTYRVATLGQVDPSALQILGDGMAASFCDILSAATTIDGPRVAADMLNHTGRSVEKNVFDQMDAQDPEFSERVRRMMFTFADLDKLTDRELQIVLREADQKDLVVSMKACGEGLLQRLLQNLSEETRTFLRQELAQLSPIRRSEAEEVQMRVVQTVRQLEQQGKVTIVRGDADNVWV